jgi:hypothetical protein
MRHQPRRVFMQYNVYADGYVDIKLGRDYYDFAKIFGVTNEELQWIYPLRAVIEDRTIAFLACYGVKKE